MIVETTAVLTTHGDKNSKHLQNAIIRALHNARKQGITNKQQLIDIVKLVVEINGNSRSRL